ncbi:MAG: TMEM165/GDT1 family protein [Oscillatoriales cyanobacterium]|nr:MAG: TMEM165/GDT1 family protein [Oscillatoriales cyanobacterium]
MSAPEPSIVPSETPNTTAKTPGKSTFVSVFTSTFFTILFAEMGDKTQLTTLLMTAESQKPLMVFLGAGSALVTTSLLGVLLGRWLASRVSEAAIETAAGIALMVIAVLLIGDMLDMT